MKRIPVNSIASGQRFSRPVYVDKNNILVGAHVAIKDSDIDRLHKWGYQFVETDGELVVDGREPVSASGNANTNDEYIREYEKLLERKEEFLRIVHEAHVSYLTILSEVKGRKPFNNALVYDITNSLMDIVKENKNIFIFLPRSHEIGLEYLAAHSVNVAILAAVFGQSLNFKKLRLQELTMSALLFDIGMVQMPREVLEKKEKLNEKELNLIKTHPIIGYKLLTEHAKVKINIAQPAFMHHECYDGSGYPRGIKGPDIDENARIVAILDHFEALTRKRPFREKLPAYESMKSLLSQEINKLDPNLMRIFLSRMAIYPIGSLVKLNNGIIGMVIDSIEKKPLRPILKIVIDEFGERTSYSRVINLLDATNLYIVSYVDETELGLSPEEIL